MVGEWIPCCHIRWNVKLRKKVTENDLSYGEVRPPEMMHLISKMDKINFCFDAHVFKENQTDVLERIYIKNTKARILVLSHWINPPKNSQDFVEKAHYPDATPLRISIRTHSIPAWNIRLKMKCIDKRRAFKFHRNRQKRL